MAAASKGWYRLLLSGAAPLSFGISPNG